MTLSRIMAGVWVRRGGDHSVLWERGPGGAAGGGVWGAGGGIKRGGVYSARGSWEVCARVRCEKDGVRKEAKVRHVSDHVTSCVRVSVCVCRCVCMQDGRGGGVSAWGHVGITAAL